MRFGRSILTVAVLAAIALSAWGQSDFWLPRYDESNSGVSADSLKLPISLRWKYSTGDEEATVVATPAVGADMIYAPVGSTIYAIDRITGELVWSQDAGDSIYSSPALVDGILYFGSRDNSLWAVDAANGEVKWRYPTGGPVDCAPVVIGNTIYFGSDDNRLTALDLETHQPLWQFEANGDIKATPLVYRDVIVVGSMDRHIYCLNYQGRPLWTKIVDERAFFAAPTGERAKIIYGCGRELVAREIYTGRRLWHFKTGGLITGAPSVQNRRVYVGTGAGVIYCIDANNGRGLWKYPAEGVTDPITSSLTIVDNLIVFRAGERRIMAVSARDGSEQWSYSLPEPPEKKKKATETTPGMGEPGADIAIPDEGVDVGPAIPEDTTVGGEDTGTTTTTRKRAYVMEEHVDPAVAVTGDALYVIGDDNTVYGFASQAADNVPPVIGDAILEVPGKGRQRVSFAPNTTIEDDFEGRYADEIVIPGTPPIFLSAVISDEGSGIDPDSVKVSVNGEPTDDFTWDPKEGILWYIYDPRGAALNLSNGVKNIMFEANDWRGNRATLCVSFTVDNKAKPPEPPKPKAPTVDMMGPEGEMVPPGEMAPAMP
ncbi:MAG: PQQ-binding-like beta-propeller repeat protein [Armatimonadetes bacterium]|nr:PQQ-binding-like beta-propeller repeat protein [Armatimonadota bacterium]